MDATEVNKTRLGFMQKIVELRASTNADKQNTTLVKYVQRGIAEGYQCIQWWTPGEGLGLGERTLGNWPQDTGIVSQIVHSNRGVLG